MFMPVQRVAASTSRSRNRAVVTTKVAEEVRDLLKTRGPRFELDLCGTVSSNPVPSSGAVLPSGQGVKAVDALVLFRGNTTAHGREPDPKVGSER